MGFLDGLFERKFDKPLADSGTIEHATKGGFRGGSWSGYTLGTGTKWGLDNSLNYAYSRVVWVFRCVHAIASAQASLTIHQKDLTTKQGHVVDNPDFYRLINKKPNPYESANRFRYRLSSLCLLSIQGAFIEVVKRNGKPAELYLLDPGTVEPVRDAKKWVSGYKVERAKGKYDLLNPDDIIWVIPTPHPTDVYRNVTPLESCGLAVETDYFARMYNRNFLKRDGRPGMLIGVDGDILPEDAEELKELFSGGYSSAGETRVIEAENIHVVDFSTKPRDAQWAEAIGNAKDNILAAFGVPESVLGNASGRCLRATELVHLANGSIVPAAQLVGQEFELMQPLNGGQRAIKAKAEYAKHENVYKVTTFSGRTLEVNGEHPLFMAVSREKQTSKSYRGTKRDIFPYGWTGVGEIKRSFDQNDRVKKGVYTEVAVPLVFDQAEGTDFDLDKALELGVAFEEVPDAIFEANTTAQKSFLTGVYSEHGRMSQHTGFDLYVPTREYARKLQMLLMRIGVASYINSKKMTHVVTICGFVNMRHFLDQVELTGKNAENAKKVRERIEVKSDEDIRQEGLLRTDALPIGLVWDRILDIEDLGEDDTVAISIDDSQFRHYLSLFWEHNTYNNADAEGESFWTGTMLTHCNALAEALEPLTGSDNDQTYLEFDFDDVDVLQAVKRRRLDRYRQDLLDGSITMNDYRIICGLDPIDEPYFRVYFNPNGAIGGDPDDVRIVMTQMIVQNNPGIQNAITGGTVGNHADQRSGEAAASGGASSQTVFDQAARTIRAAVTNGTSPQAANPRMNSEIAARVNTLINRQGRGHGSRRRKDDSESVEGGDIHRDLRHKTIGFIEGSLESWSTRQLDVVSDRLSHTKVRKGTRHWDGGVVSKNLDTDYIVDVDEWTDEAVEPIIKVLRSTLNREAQAWSNDLLDSGYKPKNGEDFVTKSDMDGILGEIEAQLRKSILQQSKLVQRHIGIQDKAGFSIEEMKDTLNHPENFDRFNWISLLAKRMTTFAIESMFDKLYNNVDAKVSKEWKTSDSEHFRESHASLDGKILPVDQQFDLGNEKIAFPTAIINSEGDNCACYLVYGVEQ